MQVLSIHVIFVDARGYHLLKYIFVINTSQIGIYLLGTHYL